MKTNEDYRNSIKQKAQKIMYKRKQRNRYLVSATSALACLILVICAVTIIPNLIDDNMPTENPGNTYPPTVSGNDTPESAHTPTAPDMISVSINELGGAPSGNMAMISLSGEDFISMTYDKIIEYFNVTLPVTDALPYLRLQPQQDYSYGIYKTDERGVYYDGNSFFYSNEGGAQSLNVTLAKVFFHVYDWNEAIENVQRLEFSKINDRGLAIFHYPSSNGSDCYYVEFVQDGIAYYVVSDGLSEDDFVKCLSSLVAQTSESDNSHTLTGTVSAVDGYASRIGITLDGGQEYKHMGVYLPKGETEKYSLYQKVIITYKGEPATVGCIWEQQLISIDIVNE